MNSLLTPLYVRSVPPSFSWDNANYTISPTNLVPTVQNINGSDILVYTGYAPVTQVLLDSDPYIFDASAPYHVRSINFGDYYNSSTNVLNVSGLADVKFSHTYIMPGVYQAVVSEAEYSNINSVTWNEISVLSNPNLIWTSYTGISSVIQSGQSTVIPNVTAFITETTANFLLSVVEIMPTAYLSSNIPIHPQDITFPLTLTITPRFTQTGSFPIEKIVWDMGDGSPLITKRRWGGYNNNSFVFSNALSADPLDPRNYDVTHTYLKQKGVSTFYPCITAYTSSTNSSDICAITIGPILDTNIGTDTLNVIQNDLNKDGSVILGQIGTNTAFWKAP